MNSGPRKWLTLLALVWVGEGIFVLPFVVPRIFRPTLLEVYGVDNTQLGAAFSLYGTVAMASYLLGGPLADRFSKRKMMAAALVSTALGGVYAATIPSPTALVALYGLWGVTTILLFWAGLLVATREWGGSEGQGRAYGLLDGGRGLFAALVSSTSLALFAALVPADSDPELKRVALQGVLLVGAGFTGFGAVLVLALVPEPTELREPIDLRAAGKLVARPSLWFQAAIVVCAYVAYKGTDDLGLLTVDVLGYTDVQSASVSTLAFWIRPVAAVGAGFLADRMGGWRTIAGCFALLLLADLGVVWGSIHLLVPVLFASIVATCVAVYALRGVYFALFEEGNIPLGATGTAVGLVSLVGYTPDVFFGPLMGWILDGSPGAEGHVQLHGVLAAFAVLGLISTLGFAATVPASRSSADPHPRHR